MATPPTTAGSDPSASGSTALSVPDAPASNPALDVEVLIVGAGVSGLAMAIELLRHGQRSFVLLEAAESLGGTWRDNTYPGIAVDIPSISYSYSFESGYPWSRNFAPGAEILEYLKHVATKYEVAPHIRYGARVARTAFDADADCWRTELEDGRSVRSRYLVSATGLLSQPKYPSIEGLDSFAGKAMHTARWDHSYDVTDKRVGVIGTGASAVQVVPAIARQVKALTVFQRTPVWVSSRPERRLSHGVLSPRRYRFTRDLVRFASEALLEFATFCIVSYRRFPFLVGIGQLFLRGFLRRTVKDPALRAQLTPSYGLGCKRPATSNHYLSSFNHAHVSLVTEAIERITPEGVRTRDGSLHALDALVLATGFLTTERGNSPSFEVRGLNGQELGEHWERARFHAYAGVAVPQFPNFFLTAGPYSGGFNWFTMVETHVRHIMACIERARALNTTRIEVRSEAHDAYMNRMWGAVNATVFKDPACVTANSYYLDRHGDASLPLPRTPWWRSRFLRRAGVSAYRFGAGDAG